MNNELAKRVIKKLAKQALSVLLTIAAVIGLVLLIAFYPLQTVGTIALIILIGIVVGHVLDVIHQEERDIRCETRLEQQLKANDEWVEAQNKMDR